MVNFNPGHLAVLDEMLLNHPHVRAGKMFGYPAFYADKKLCVCLYEQGVGLKLPEKTVEELLRGDSNAVPFQPLGRPRMREWVQINLTNSQDYRQYQPLFEESIRFLLSQQSVE